MHVPVLAGSQNWGSVELRFTSLHEWRPSDWWRSPLVHQAVFIALASCAVFYFFLKKILRHLDPSRVVPARVRATLDTMASGLVILDDEGRIVLANRAFAAVVGREPDQLQGSQANDLPWSVPPSGLPAQFPWSRVLSTGETLTGSLLELKMGDDPTHSYMVNSAPISGDDGKCRGVLASFEDVTQLERTRAELEKMLDELHRSRDEVRRKNDELTLLATRDPLTGCFNRRSFFETFETLWEAAHRHRLALSCLMVDIDNFKAINDKCGHSWGDVVLQKAARALSNAARACDVICRYGGEEFCILLPQTDLEHAMLAAERFRAAVHALDCPDLNVTVSLGVSALSLGATTPQGLIDQADKSLYVAKQHGRNQVVRWDQVLCHVVREDFEIPRRESENNGPNGEHDSGQLRSRTRSSVASISAPLEEPELASISFGVVSTLLAALAYRDTATAEHSRRVADLCVMVGSRRMSVRETYVLEIAALLHDIGKIGVPDAILLKPGPLTEEEWKIMVMHDHIGVDIVDSTFTSPALLEIMRNHHAFFGASSRHQHLPSGQNIPLGARILSIADAYDAIVSDRVYRKSRSRAEAFDELRRYAGRQFDPELVDIFIDTVSAHDQSRRELAGPVSKQAAVQIGCQIEKLSDALDNRDCASLTSLADRLQQVARKQGIDEIAQVAGQLRSSASDSDLVEVVRLTIELLDLCRSIQDVLLQVDGQGKSYHLSPN